MELKQLHTHFLNSSGVSTDTRNIEPGMLFFCLKGDNFNGNKFAQEALDKGAYKVIIDETRYHKNTGETILCADVLEALQKLAHYHRNYLKVPIIALTGSNGKTTTKELINAVISTSYTTTATKGNLNNHIGVPLTLLAMNNDTQYGIVEMGANHHKEIEQLCAITAPDFGYITNFGKAHLEGFGSLEGVVQAKTELYDYLKDHKKTVFVNGNDPKQMIHSKNINRVVFGTDQQYIPISLKDASNELIVQYNNEVIQSKLIGSYNFHNIAAAIAIGSYLNIPTAAIKKAIESYTPTNNRSQVIDKDSNKIILDAYNANPTSMIAALENFKQFAGSNKKMFLGDMFEVGKDTAEEHEAIILFLKENPFGEVYVIGSNFYNTNTEAPHIKKFITFEDLKEKINEQKITDSTLLIKASRGMALERILDLL
ncbi:UDP-N-acetylmuramoyl-tripeptide--D-alanyl-D-alanine ligase [Cochleicola gelatinilyticus]|uniref:UDP-N-acetylmuramoyl-tripeptide--D-alanyl-D-alanine ligase n=1 Tax=Cochleicola gelatinilyticus TaxID=1763537 RepID=A0A167JEM2_9FLAO|nr:UDP-N-acetylmuramoyl-tripeptide--D-alanyl-D-alanine ligase [Cochleicola gelatinilyticus]OAB80597.1 UDP-N-acetylmuramoyl-tripeptide--D-alanyl-D-alanine ligase [Cochleicola gelatinilyticus]